MSRYGVAVGQRWANAEGRLQELPVALEAAEALAAVELAGFEVALLVPEAVIPRDVSKLNVRTRATLLLVELAPPKPAPEAGS